MKPVAPRQTARRDRHRRKIRQGQPPCYICGGEINYSTASHLDPLAFEIDHIIPISKGGLDVLENLAPAHRKCNQVKSDGPRELKAAVGFVTDRAW